MLLVLTISFPDRADARQIRDYSISDIELNDRPDYHFTVPKEWMNDPQRPVYNNGHYNFYYLYNEDYSKGVIGTSYHLAQSDDLVSFKDKGDAIPKSSAPDGNSIWSGSTVIDKTNTAGFGENAVVALVTSLDTTRPGNPQAQFLYYSTDGGEHFKAYSQHPVLANPGARDFRDPKIVWDSKRNQWVMVLAEGNQIGFYRSENLIHWEKTGTFMKKGLGSLECPDFFQMKADDGSTHWILGMSANGKNVGEPNTYVYWIGSFDGKVFTPNTVNGQWLDYGWDWYAAVTWGNHSENNDPLTNRYAIGWMNNWDYVNNTITWDTEGFNGTDSLVRVINLRKYGSGYHLYSEPNPNLRNYLKTERTIKNIVVNGKKHETPIIGKGISYELEFDLQTNNTNHAGIRFRQSRNGSRFVELGFDGKEIYLDRSSAPHPDQQLKRFERTAIPNDQWNRKNNKQTHHIQLFVDKSTIEVFVDHGRYVMSDVINSERKDDLISVFTDSSGVKLTNVTLRTFYVPND
jgi:levanbiose-producing levanase